MTENKKNQSKITVIGKVEQFPSYYHGIPDGANPALFCTVPLTVEKTIGGEGILSKSDVVLVKTTGEEAKNCYDQADLGSRMLVEGIVTPYERKEEERNKESMDVRHSPVMEMIPCRMKFI